MFLNLKPLIYLLIFFILEYMEQTWIASGIWPFYNMQISNYLSCLLMDLQNGKIMTLEEKQVYEL